MKTLDFHVVAHKIQKSEKLNSNNYLWAQIFNNMSYDTHIQKNQKLSQTISAIPYRKYILTNSPIERTMRILECLDIVKCFDGIMTTDQKRTNFCHVPASESFNCFEQLFIDLKKENLVYFTPYENVSENVEQQGWSVVECTNANLLQKLTEELERLETLTAGQ